MAGAGKTVKAIAQKPLAPLSAFSDSAKRFENAPYQEKLFFPGAAQTGVGENQYKNYSNSNLYEKIFTPTAAALGQHDAAQQWNRTQQKAIGKTEAPPVIPPPNPIPDIEDLRRARRRQIARQYAVGGRAGTILSGPGPLGGATDVLGG